MVEKFDFSKNEEQKEFAFGGENLPQEEKDKIVGEAMEESIANPEDMINGDKPLRKIEEKIEITKEKIEQLINQERAGDYKYKAFKERLKTEKELRYLKSVADFEVAHLTEPIIKSEKDKERFTQIKREIIDIQDYQGFIHRTQISNLKNILVEGFTQETIRKMKWGYGGLYKKRALEMGDHVYLSPFFKIDSIEIRDGKVEKIYESSFKNNEGLHWKEAGPVILLFDSTKFKNISFDSDVFFVHRNNLAKQIEEIIKNRKEYWSRDNGDQFFLNNKEDEEKLLKDAIMGIVIIGEGEHRLERSILKGKKLSSEKSLSFSQKQIYEIVSNRLSRIFNNKKSRVVPVYDRLGNLLWPKKMSYEEVKKFVAERDKNKTGQH